MDTSQDALLYRVAVHEAGHAAMAALGKSYINSVELCRRSCGNASGEVDVEGPLDLDDVEFIKYELLQWQAYYGAGAAAEVIVLHDRLEEGLEGDRKCHHRMNEKFGLSDDFEAAVQRAHSEIENLKLSAVAKYFLDEMGARLTFRLGVTGVPLHDKVLQRRGLR